MYLYGYFKNQPQDEKESQLHGDGDRCGKIWGLTAPIFDEKSETAYNCRNLTNYRCSDMEYNILNWLAVLTHYRSYWQNGSISEEAKDYLQRHFFVDPTPYDVIIGYRADDSYFTFAQDFVSNAIPLSKLSEAMRLGKPGEQIVFKSETSFTRIHFTGAEPASASIYYEKKTMRDRNARREYWKAKKTDDTIHGLYMLDIMREGITNGDSRLR